MESYFLKPEGYKGLVIFGQTALSIEDMRRGKGRTVYESSNKTCFHYLGRQEQIAELSFLSEDT